MLPKTSGAPELGKAARLIKDGLAACRSGIGAVIAPSGWGKTTAAREAIAGSKYVWCRLDNAPKHEPGALMHSVAAALALPLSQFGPLMSVGRQNDSIERISTWLQNAIEQGFVLVLDDFQQVAEDKFSELFLQSLLQFDRKQILLISRPTRAVERLISALDARFRIRQSDLCLSMGDLKRSHAKIDVATAKAILKLTGGRPASVHLALAALVDDKNAVPGARTQIAFGALATAFFDSLKVEQQELLFDLSLCGDFDLKLLRGLGHQEVTIRWLFDSAVPLVEIDGCSFHLHELFRDLVRGRIDNDVIIERSRRILDVLVWDGSRIGSQG